MYRAVAILAALITTVPSLAYAQGGVSVGGFETDGSVGLSREEYQAIGRALGSLLSDRLERSNSTAVIPIEPTHGRQAGRIDVAAARAAASDAGARILVVGSLLDQYGDITVEARIIDAKTGKPLAVVRGDPALDKREQLAEAIVALANRLATAPGIGGAVGAAPSGGIPVVALIEYGRGLGSEESGDNAAAAKAYRAALTAAPGFAEAARALTRVGG